MNEPTLPPPGRRIYCNRTLNLRAVKAVGCDMDYTLIHYKSEVWEARAYAITRDHLARQGLPVAGLEFDPSFATLGLIFDLELGNIVKANRFGFVRRASHGTRMLDFEEQREAYSQVQVDLSEPRWVFMNTLFALSEACLYAQVVDLREAGKIDRALGYAELYRRVKSALDETHLEGTLKEGIMAEPDTFVVLDPELPLALLDLKHAGKKLMLITNSEYSFTRAMMSYAFDRFLPAEQTWRSLFDVVLVGARKPAFFSQAGPAFRVVDEARGLLEPWRGALHEGGVYLGGHAGLVEESLGLRGDEILYVGDHMFADVHVSKALHRWRTALIVRELEGELAALDGFHGRQAELTRMMSDKELFEHRFSLLRLELQRLERGYGPPPTRTERELRAQMTELRNRLVALDERIAPLARASAELENARWGLIMRTGNDKSHLARQIEKHADIYTSRVSNLLWSTPFVYLRSPRGSLPHDSGPAGGVSSAPD
ncbi:MAG: HAD-IG family 5'-nucleotidase [Sorangiineae bacterium]|nr:HAD-IG family 5'-nucleotidase [Polyangiaceae bacterium]MEB2322830.1 HAD-IG family 5'-nucleotidase [Sorangiineae bacterium]